MTGLRIALVHPFCWPEVRRGGERYLADLASYLHDAGHRVRIVTGTDGPSTTDTLDGTTTDVPVHRLRHLPTPGPLRRRGLGPVETFGLRAAALLARHRHDVVHALTPTGALAGRLTAHPTLYTVLGQPDAAHFADHRTERRITGAAVRLATDVAALSEATAAVEQRVFGRAFRVLPPGVRPEVFPADLAPRTGPPRILFPADASDRRKRVDLAFAAMPVVLDRFPDARLVLGGPGDHRWAIDGLGAERAAVLAATDVTGVGAVADVPARYRAATVTLLPSTGEAFGLGVLESLTCGTPAVCLADGGPPEIVGDDGRAGVVANAPDGASVGAAVVAAVELARHADTPAACTARAARWAWDRVGPEHVAAYESLRRRPPRGDR